LKLSVTPFSKTCLGPMGFSGFSVIESGRTRTS
jgi:hypothetical protein